MNFLIQKIIYMEKVRSAFRYKNEKKKKLI